VQFDITHLIEALRAGVDLIPPPIIAMVLLGGPTAGWLLYRYVVQPRSSRMHGVDASALWVCPSCRSVNGMHMARCYRCDSLPDEADLEVVDPHPAGPVTVLPVGPGLDLGGGGRPTTRPRPVTQIERAETVWSEDEDDRTALPDVAAMTEVAEVPGRRRSARPPTPIPVGPGRPPVNRPAVVRPRRAVVAGTSRDPDDSPAA
jgi:hypothetical protein